MKKKLIEWFSQSLKEIKETGDVRDIHIDEFSDSKLKKSEDYLKVSCAILKELSLIAKNVNLSGLRIDLNIELKESSKFKGQPIDKKSIVKDIDILSMPEILIYKPLPDTNLTVNLVEFYRTPVLFKIGEGVDHFQVFYEEYRNYSKANQKENFSRWLNFVFKE